MIARGSQSQQGRGHVKNPVTPGFRPGYDIPAIEQCCNRGQIEERTYDWSQKSYDRSQRSWVIARGKSVATMLMVMFKTGRATLRPVVPPIDYSRRMLRLIVRSIIGGHD